MDNVTQSDTQSVNQNVLAEQEAKDAIKACVALRNQLEDLGPLAREELARELGYSANKMGRPNAHCFLAFVMATSSCGLVEKVRLARLANGSASHAMDGRKDVIRVTVKGDACGKEQASWQVMRPVDLDGKF